MENNEMDEAKIEAVVIRAVSPLSKKVDELEAKVDRLVYWTAGTSLTTIVVALGLVGFAISVFGNHMQSLQMLMTAMQLSTN